MVVYGIHITFQGLFGKQPLILELWNARHRRTLKTKNTGIEKQSTRASNELKKREKRSQAIVVKLFAQTLSKGFCGRK